MVATGVAATRFPLPRLHLPGPAVGNAYPFSGSLFFPSTVWLIGLVLWVQGNSFKKGGYRYDPHPCTETSLLEMWNPSHKINMPPPRNPPTHPSRGRPSKSSSRTMDQGLRQRMPRPQRTHARHRPMATRSRPHHTKNTGRRTITPPGAVQVM